MIASRAREKHKTKSVETRKTEVAPIQDPFDFRFQTQEILLKTRMASPSWRKRAEQWYRQTAGKEPSLKDIDDGWYRVSWPDDISAHEMVERLYDFFLLEEASQIILQMIPGFRPDLEKVLANLVLIEAEGQDAVPQNFAYMLSGGAHLLFLDKAQPNLVGSGRYLDTNHTTRVLFVVHELLHALLVERHKIKLDTTIQNPYNSLSAVLHEALATSMEVPIARAIFDRSGEDELLNQYLDKYGYTSTAWMIAINEAVRKRRGEGRKIDWPEKIRAFLERRKPKFKRVKPAVLDIQQLNYREGVRLANALRRRGWQVEDIPRLLEEIDKLLWQGYDGEYQSKIANLPIDKTPGSEYQQVFTAITSLKP